MPCLILELPQQKRQTAFNLRRWTEVLANRELTSLPGRIETDRHGNIVMSPPPAPDHGSYQLEIGFRLRSLMETGRVLTECPISTADGVRAADVAWASPEKMRELGDKVCFERAPEICVEVISPGNTAAEIRDKVRLHFDAGAAEVWTCDARGAMAFLTSATSRPRRTSIACPDFPAHITLR